MAWAPDYVTTEELAAFVRVPDEADAAQMGLAIAAASRAIDKSCKRQFGQAETQRYYTARVDNETGLLTAFIDDLMTTNNLVVKVDDGTGTYPKTVTDYTLTPRNASADNKPWTKLVSSALGSLEGGVRITANFGWVSVPDAIVQACLLQSSRLLARRDSPFGVAGSPDAGSEVRLLAKVDPDVAVILRPYTKRAWFA